VFVSGLIVRYGKQSKIMDSKFKMEEVDISKKASDKSGKVLVKAIQEKWREE